jgi:sulfite dehydrogenase (cytochrome) subunit B
MQRTIVIFAFVFALAAGPALADEKIIELKKAPGREVVEANCGACHSLDYIKMNSPFLTAKTWETEVSKMIKIYGAPIEEVDANAILGYLIENYGG